MREILSVASRSATSSSLAMDLVRGDPGKLRILVVRNAESKRMSA